VADGLRHVPAGAEVEKTGRGERDLKTMAREYARRPSPGGRLRAVLEGRGGELVITPQQARERDAILRSWRQDGEQP
jgi:hypothetical protein